MKTESRTLRLDPRTGRYTRAQTERRRARPLTWRQARIVATLAECGPLTQTELHRKLGIAPALGHQLAGLWKRQILYYKGGRWQVNKQF